MFDTNLTSLDMPVTIFTAFTTRERPAGVQEDEEEEDPDDNLKLHTSHFETSNFTP